MGRRGEDTCCCDEDRVGLVSVAVGCLTSVTSEGVGVGLAVDGRGTSVNR